MSDPLGDRHHVSPLVSDPNDPRHPGHRQSSHGSHDQDNLYHHEQGPARVHSKSSAVVDSSDTPSQHPASSSPSSSAPAPASPADKLLKRRRPETPQLSERDSIFATHYLVADSGSTTPNLPAAARIVKGDARDQDVAAGNALPGPISSTARIASSLQLSDSASPYKMHMAPESAPYSSSSPAPPLSRAGAAKQPADESHNPAVDATPDTDDKGREDWDLANEKGKTRPSARRHRSDEQIQATLANEEPIGHARSRKASHYLGLFRENAKEKEQQQKSRERTKEVYGIGKEVQEDLSELNDRQRAGEIESLEEAGNGDILTRPTPRLDVEKPFFAPIKSHDSAAAASSIDERGEAQPKSPDQSVAWFSEGAPSGAYPIRLLEEIREHPVAQRHVADNHRESSPSSPSVKPQSRTPAPPQSGPQPEPVDKPLTLPPDAEGDESDKEHISAATYFPHQAASPDDIHGQEKSGESFSDLGDPAISPRTTPTTTPKTAEPVASFKLDREAPFATDAPPRVTSPDSIDKNSILLGTLPRRVDTGLSAVSETEYESVDDDADDQDELADVEHTPTATPRVRPTKVLRKARRPRSPLGAVELKPYKHQVGGHTKVFSFSKQAICKELNNRENSFYEVIERRHPELLEFMPRYLGVLNVTYTKAKRKQQPVADAESAAEPAPEADEGSAVTNGETQEPQERVISHSKNFSAHDESIPQVIYANNMHIIPSNLFPIVPALDGSVRPATANGVFDSGSGSGPSKSVNVSNGDGTIDSNGARQNSLPSRPSVKDFPSWGATMVNTKLKERVLRDVFSPPVIHAKHNRRVRKPLTGDSFSDPKLLRSETQHTGRSKNRDELLSAALLKSASDLTPVSSHEDIHRGGSAPAHHSSFNNLRERSSIDSNASDSAVTSERHIARRRSDQGLQRLQCDIDTSKRSGLTYYEDEDFAKDKEDDIFAMDMQNGHGQASHAIEQNAYEAKASSTLPRAQNPASETADGLVPLSQQTSHDSRQIQPFSLPPIPAPVNPLQAQLHNDERVRHFLLLEDLTANMVKPCVLDLKMGTRQYGIEANQKKRTSQRMKCKMTTSRQLGVRLCGMQVWNVKKQEYAFEDKYAGRDLRAGREFQAALRRFLFDGVSPASVTRHIPLLLDKLSRLEQIVSQLPRYRFYASSLLLIYDGADLPSQKSVERGGKGELEAEQSGQGTTDKAQAASAAGKDRPPESNIDIRLVDFANCVTSQTKRLADAPSPPHHPNQPDRGYIKGLRSLRSYLQRIWMEINTEEAGSWVERGEGEAMAIAQRGAGNADQPEGWRKAGEATNDEGEVSE